jgi:Xaa-Pro aminopeptidase
LETNVQVLNTTLVLGPFDWDPAIVPLAEFDARLAAVRRALAQGGATALLVHGDTFDHGALTYLTGFTPKLGAGFALIPVQGKPRVFFMGGAMMGPACKKLTWVEDVLPAGNLPKTLATAFAPLAPEGGLSLALWEGAALPQRLQSVIRAAVKPLGRTVEMQASLESLRRRKSECERALLKRAAAVLAGAVDSLRREVTAGSGARSAALAAERQAYKLGAQDVRILASTRPGGPPLPFEGSTDPQVAPLLASVAVRYAGYWAEAHLTLGATPSSLLQRAEGALEAALKSVRAGVSSRHLLNLVDAALAPYSRNPTRRAGYGIGLSLEEAPDFSRQDTTLEPGDVCSLAVDVPASGAEAGAVVSAMFLVHAGGADLLWPGVPSLP